MSKIIVTLTADGMGPEADEADFDALASYVAERIDERTGLSVEVDQHAFSGPGSLSTNTIVGADSDERQTIREALDALWEEFCADASAWPKRAPSRMVRDMSSEKQSV